jgi:signal transduction histidine kinase
MSTHRAITLDEELLNIIASEVRSSPYVIIMSMSLVAYMLYQQLPDMPWVWGGWLSLVVITQFYRMHRLPRLPLLTHRPAKRRAREAAVVNSVSIGIQSLSLLAFPFFTPFEAAVQTMIFVGIGVGSIVAAVGWAPYTLSHIWLTLVPVYMLWAWSGLYGPAGTLGILIALVGCVYSVTLWLISKRLYRMNEVFFANHAALALALDEAETAGLARTRFLADASHDLRQPLHALSLFSASLRMHQLNDRTREISINIEAAVMALSSQLDSLLDISKLDAGVVSVKTSLFDLSESLDRLCGEMQTIANAAAIKLQVECPSEAIVLSDPALFELLVRNLLTNAVTHNRKCSVRVVAVAKSDRWEIAVIDTGVGIPLEEQERVFEEFYQLQNPGGGPGKGLGLGLSVVRRLAKLLKVELEFVSAPGQGTSFRFSMPIGIL